MTCTAVNAEAARSRARAGPVPGPSKEYDPGLWKRSSCAFPAFLSDGDVEMMFRIAGKLDLLNVPRR